MKRYILAVVLLILGVYTYSGAVYQSGGGGGAGAATVVGSTVTFSAEINTDNTPFFEIINTGTGDTSNLRIAGDSGDPGILFSDGAIDTARITYDRANDILRFRHLGMNFSQWELDVNGNLRIFEANAGAETLLLFSDGAIRMQNFVSELPPTTDNIVLRSTDVSSSSELFLENENNDITQLSGSAIFPLGITISGSTLSVNAVTYQFPSADGSSAQVLHTDGSGNLTWDTDDTTVGAAVLSATQTFSGQNTFEAVVTVSTDIVISGEPTITIASMTVGGDAFSVEGTNILIGTTDLPGDVEILLTIQGSEVGGATGQRIEHTDTDGQAYIEFLSGAGNNIGTLLLNGNSGSFPGVLRLINSTTIFMESPSGNEVLGALEDGGVAIFNHIETPATVTNATVILAQDVSSLSELFIKNENADLTQISGSAIFPLGLTIDGSTLSVNSVVYQFPSADGSSAQVLHTDGSGNLTWDTDDGIGSAVLTATQTFSGQNTFEAIVTITTTTNIGDGELEIPNAADPTLTVLGEIGYDTTDNTLQIFDGTAERVIAHDIFQVNFTVADDGDWTDERVPIWQAPKDMAVTIVEVRAAAMGTATPTLDYNIQERAEGSINSEGTNIYTSTVTADGNGDNQTSFANASIASGAYLVFSTTGTAQGGTVDFLVGTVYYRKDAE